VALLILSSFGMASIAVARGLRFDRATALSVLGARCSASVLLVRVLVCPIRVGTSNRYTTDVDWNANK